MMSSNSNFLLKIHMEEEENTTEIFLNKERRSFTFINDECISDLVIPEFKITSLNMILQNVSDDKGDDSFYAEYEKNNEIVREYDREKITILSNMITKISINDFLDYQKDIKINEYYVDNIVDAYNCVLPTKLKKIISYTTNGVVFNGEEIIYFLPHDEIVSYDGPIENFIPLMIKNGKNYIGYDFKESLYKEYDEEKVINEGKNLDDLIEIIDIISIDHELEKNNNITETIDEVVFDDEETNMDVESEDIDIEEELNKLTVKAEDIDTQIARIDAEYESTIKNIDYQFEKLNNGILKKEEKQEYQFKEKKIVEPTKLEKTKEKIAKVENKDEKAIAEKIAQLDHEIAKIKYEKTQASKVIKEDEIGEEAETILEELDKEIEKLENLKEKVNNENIELPEDVEDSGEKILNKLTELILSTHKIKKSKKTKIEQLNHEIEKIKYEKAQASKVVKEDEIGEEAELLLTELDEEIAKLHEMKEKVNSENIELPENVEDSGEHILTKLASKIEQTNQIKKSKKEKLAQLNHEIEKIKYEKEQASRLVKEDEIGEEAEAVLEELDKEIEKLENLKEKVNNENIELPEDVEDSGEKILNKLTEIILSTHKIKRSKKEKIAQLNHEIEKIKYEKAQASKVIKEDKIGEEAEAILGELDKEIEKLENLKEKVNNENIELPEDIEDSGEHILNKLSDEIGKKQTKQEKTDKTKKIEEEIRIGIKKSLSELEKTNDIIDEIDQDIAKVVENEEEAEEEEIEVNNARLDYEIQKLEYERKQAEKLILEESIGKKAEELLEELTVKISELKKVKTTNSKIDGEQLAKIEKDSNEILNKLMDAINSSYQEKKEKEAKIAQINHEIEKIKYEKKQAEKVIIEDEVGKKAEDILQELNFEIARLDEIKAKIISDNIELPEDIENSGNEIFSKIAHEIEEVNKVRKTKKEKIEQIKHEIEKLNYEKKQALKVVKEDEIGEEAENILKELDQEITKLNELKEKVTKEDIELPEDLENSGEVILYRLSQLIEHTNAIKKSRKEKLAQLDHEIEKIKYEKKQALKVVKEDEIGEEAENILSELDIELENLEQLKAEVVQANIDLPEDIENSGEAILSKLANVVEINHKVKQEKKMKIEQLDHEIEKIKYEKAQAAKVVKEDKIGTEAENILKELDQEIKKLKDIKAKVKSDNVELPEDIEDSGESILLKLSLEIERVIAERNEIKRIRKEQKEQREKEEKNTLLSLNCLINNSINNSLNNYKISLNDTKVVTVEHLPYCEFKDDFSIIQIPEIELGRLTLNPTTEIDLDKLKLKVTEMDEEKVKLYIQTASYIIDSNNNKIKKGDYITLKYNEELSLRLNKKNAMENWSLKMEKSTFEREIRNIDFHKILNILSGLEIYRKLGNIEKYELKKSIMLFLDFVMKNKDYKVLDKLYSILEKNPKIYEEHITKYNVENSLRLKDSLPSYEAKKAYYTKLNYINGLIDAKWLDYPRYIFNSHNYFNNDPLLEEFIDELDETLEEKDFYDYLMNLFNEYGMFKELDIDGKENLNKCIEYLSVLYKYQPELSEDNKYKIERTFMIGATEEEMALLISKLCRRGISDYSAFAEYDAIMKEKYTLGTLKYPIYSEHFELDEIRNGGEFDEFEN